MPNSMLDGLSVELDAALNANLSIELDAEPNRGKSQLG